MKKGHLLCILFFSLFTLSRCQKNDIKQSEIAADNLAVLLTQGFDTTEIIDKGDHYLIEGDIVIYKSDILKTNVRQVFAGSDRLVSASKQGNITVRIDPSVYSSGSSFNWSSEVSQALSEYNSLESSNIRFSLVTSPSADITIKAEGSTSGAVAEAPLPAPNSGNPGHFIRINTSYSGSAYNSTQRKYILMHELGHTIGLQHTDPNGRIGTAVRVGNSPNSGPNPDPYSLMNSGSLNILSGFSNWDICAISHLYPSPPGSPVTLHFSNSTESESGYIYSLTIRNGCGDYILSTAYPQFRENLITLPPGKYQFEIGVEGDAYNASTDWGYGSISVNTGTPNPNQCQNQYYESWGGNFADYTFSVTIYPSQDVYISVDKSSCN